MMKKAQYAAAVMLVATLWGCERHASAPSPLTNEVRYTCCNMHYEKPKINDGNYQKGILIPFGTRVQILKVGRSSIEFQPAGHPAIELAYRYGKDAVPMQQYVDRIFVRDDPHAKLPKGGGKDKKRAEHAEQVRKAIEQAAVVPGMTRDEVLMSLGYPPAHRTPSLSSATWTYWANTWATFEVYFDGDTVARTSR